MEINCLHTAVLKENKQITKYFQQRSPKKEGKVIVQQSRVKCD